MKAEKKKHYESSNKSQRKMYRDMIKPIARAYNRADRRAISVACGNARYSGDHVICDKPRTLSYATWVL